MNEGARRRLMRNRQGKQYYMDMLQVIRSNPSEKFLVFKMAKYLMKSLEASGFRVFKAQAINDCKYKIHLFEMGEPALDEFDNLTETVPLSSSSLFHIRDCVRHGVFQNWSHLEVPVSMENATLDPAFYENKKSKAKSCKNIMLVPIVNNTRKKSFVLEMWRSTPFDKLDEHMCAIFTVWTSVAMQYYWKTHPEPKNLCLIELRTIEKILEEVLSFEVVVKRILHIVQQIVFTERASLFMVEIEDGNLVSTVFDSHLGSVGSTGIVKRNIRVPIESGIVGLAAVSGLTYNIGDPYEDKRFNRKIDEPVGYKTKSVLCMPVKIENRVIAVVLMANKKLGNTFDFGDENGFRRFAPFFALALHHSMLYEKISWKEQTLKLTMDVLSGQKKCDDQEIKEFQKSKPEKINVNLRDLYLDSYQICDVTKCQAVLVMFDDLFKMKDTHKLTKFILTVKKNYLHLPYHNFEHAWSVTQAMYSILKKDNSSNFTHKQQLAMFVACLCHDLDHRNYTYKYMSELTASPLKAMYSTSSPDNHSFNITMTILQGTDQNIFTNFSGNDYKEITSLIRMCISATDLAVVSPNICMLRELCTEQTFDWKFIKHREMAMTLAMSACDLSALAKPWHVHCIKTAAVFEEFYLLGDTVKDGGNQPIPIIDRNHPELQAEHQIKFMLQVGLPCFKVLHKLLPATKPLLDMTAENLQKWFKKTQVKRKAKIAEAVDINKKVTDEQIPSCESLSLDDILVNPNNSPPVFEDSSEEGRLDEAAGTSEPVNLSGDINKKVTDEQIPSCESLSLDDILVNPNNSPPVFEDSSEEGRLDEAAGTSEPVNLSGGKSKEKAAVGGTGPGVPVARPKRVRFALDIQTRPRT